MGNPYLKWLSTTQSIYWHDSAIRKEQLAAFADGACGMTTNPFLVNATLSQDRDFWQARLDKIPQGLKGDEKVEALIQCVTGYYAEELRPIYEQGVRGRGYVCAQTNPKRTGDVSYMLAQALRYATWAPNIVIKLPATNAGIEVFEECIARGLNAAATVSFTVPQVLAVGEAFERGRQRALDNGIEVGLGTAVLMCGRLDDYLRDVAHDTKSIATEEDIVQAGTACLKRAYDIFNERGYKALLLPAGCRRGEHISDLSGAKMIMSIAPKIAKMLEDNTCFEEEYRRQVAPDTIDRLMTMPEFRKAYEPDGMSRNEFVTFGATNRTTTQFIECGWNLLEAYQY